jgi:hypothetical protein
MSEFFGGFVFVHHFIHLFSLNDKIDLIQIVLIMLQVLFLVINEFLSRLKACFFQLFKELLLFFLYFLSLRHYYAFVIGLSDESKISTDWTLRVGLNILVCWLFIVKIEGLCTSAGKIRVEITRIETKQEDETSLNLKGCQFAKMGIDGWSFGAK